MAGREVEILAELHTPYGIMPGRNRMKVTHPIMAEHPGAHPDRPFIHAERNAIVMWTRALARKYGVSYSSALAMVRKYEEFGHACSMFVFRRHDNGEMALAKPCSGCEQFLQAAHINNVSYSVEDGAPGYGGLKKLW